MRLYTSLLTLAAVASTVSAQKETYPKYFTPKLNIDTSSMDLRLAQCFATYMDPAQNQKGFCAMSTHFFHQLFQNRVFRCVCDDKGNPDHAWTKQEGDYFIKNFSDWMDETCQFHIITNTGMEIDDFCGRDW